MKSQLAVGAGAFGLVVCVSYVALLVVASGEADPAVITRLHIPFFWRTALAALHGLVAGLAAALIVRDTDRFLLRVPMAVAIVVPAVVLVAVVMP